VSEPSRSAAPHGYHTVSPYLTVADVSTLIEFLRQVFDGVVTEQLTQPDGHIAHAEVRVGDSLLMIGAPHSGSISSNQPERRPGTLYVYVADVDQTYRRAIRSGAHSRMAPSEMFYGDRVAAVVDTNDNLWWIATRKQDLTGAELQARANAQWEHDGTGVI
jgi:PhnB protein